MTFLSGLKGVRLLSTIINFRLLVVSFIVVASLMLLAGSAFAQNNPKDDTRPGWGFGDQNHVHTGPPGQSVHPVVSQNNNSEFTFSGNVAVNTGGNTTTPNGGNIVTGAAQAVLNFAVNMGQNIFGS